MTDTLSVKRLCPRARVPHVFRLFVHLFLLILSVALSAQDIHWTSEPDWEEGTLTIEGNRIIEEDGVRAYNAASRAISMDAPNEWLNAVQQLPLNSFEQARDVVLADPGLASALNDRFEHAPSSGSRPNRTVDRVSQSWTLPLYETVIPVFSSHDIPRPLPLPIGWQPDRPSTGLLIDARGRLPVHGTSEQVQLQPVLLPRIYDEQMNLVLSADMVSPEYLERWGVAAYSTDTDPDAHIERIGTEPLIIAADALFGQTPANPVIPSDAAETLLIQEINRRILIEGRIVILVDRL